MVCRTPMTGGPADDPAWRRARPWRASLVGWGLLLAACFFLPMCIKSCRYPSMEREDMIPAREVYGSLYKMYHDDIDLKGVINIPLFMPTYVFGLLVAIGSARRLTRRAEPRHRPWVLSVITLGSSVFFSGFLMYNQISWSGLDILMSIIAGTFGLIGIYLVYASLQHPARRVYLGLTFGGAVTASVWFGFMISYPSITIRYGLVLSLIASLGLVIGTIGEARAFTQRGWLQTLWAMLLCRLPPWEAPKGRCPACDYLLYGLEEMRCPECGRPFTAAEVGLPPPEAAGA